MCIKFVVFMNATVTTRKQTSCCRSNFIGLEIELRLPSLPITLGEKCSGLSAWRRKKSIEQTKNSPANAFSGNKPQSTRVKVLEIIQRDKENHGALYM